MARETAIASVSAASACATEPPWVGAVHHHTELLGASSRPAYLLTLPKLVGGQEKCRRRQLLVQRRRALGQPVEVLGGLPHACTV